MSHLPTEVECVQAAVPVGLSATAVTCLATDAPRREWFMAAVMGSSRPVTAGQRWGRLSRGVVLSQFLY